MVDKPDTIVTGAGEGGPDPGVNIDRLEYARIEGPGPVLAYMADNKAHVRRSPSDTSLRDAYLHVFIERTHRGSPAFFGPGPPRQLHS